MSPGEQIISEMIDGFGGLVSLFLTTWFNAFITPVLTMVAGWFGLATG